MNLVGANQASFLNDDHERPDLRTGFTPTVTATVESTSRGQTSSAVNGPAITADFAAPSTAAPRLTPERASNTDMPTSSNQPASASASAGSGPFQSTPSSRVFTGIGTPVTGSGSFFGATSTTAAPAQSNANPFMSSGSPGRRLFSSVAGPGASGNDTRSTFGGPAGRASTRMNDVGSTAAGGSHPNGSQNGVTTSTNNLNFGKSKKTYPYTPTRGTRAHPSSRSPHGEQLWVR